LDAYYNKSPFSFDDLGLHSSRELAQLSKALEPAYIDRFELSALVKLFKLTTSAYSGLKAGNAEEFVAVIKELSSDPNFERGELGIPFLEDLVFDQFSELGEDVKKKVVNELGSFFAHHLKIAHTPLFSFILSNTILIIVKECDGLLYDIQFLYYIASPIYDGGEWGRQFVPVIRANQELLGTKQIRLAGKEVAQTVQHWLEDYAGFVAKPDGQREPLDRVNFINKSPNVKLLTSEERAILLKLLEVFDWFCDPYVTKEVVEYFEGPIDEQGNDESTEADTEDTAKMAEVEVQGSVSKNFTSESQPASPDAGLKPVPPALVKAEQTMVSNSKKDSATFQTSTSEKNTLNPPRITPSKPKKPFFPDYHEKELPSPPEEGLLEAPGEVSSVPEPPKPSRQASYARGVDNPTKPSKPPAGVTVPHLAKPFVLGGKQASAGKASLPPILNLDELKKQALSKKGQIQGGIDKRLEELNEEIDK
jgi:hypothetical protein